MRSKLLFYVYILVIVVAMGALARAANTQWPLSAEALPIIVAMTAFMVGVEFYEVTASTGVRWVPSTPLLIASWIMFGPWVTMIISMLEETVADGFIKRRPPLRVLFNIAVSGIAVGLSGFFYHSLPLSQNLTSPLFLLPAMASVLLFFVINIGLTSAVIALSEQRRLQEVLEGNFGWHFLGGLVAAPLSSFFIFSYNFAGLWSLILFVLPLYIVYRASKVFEDMKQGHKDTVAALTTALEADEPYTHGHSYRVAQYAVRIGRRMGLGAREIETLEYAGLLHDIGKIAITNDIVCKPARLTKEEFDILSSHPVIGGEIVEQMGFLKSAADLVRHHHERPDGQGYPDGLREEEISLGSHILNLCDAVDAMCSNRPYRAALTIEQCLAEVRRFRGKQFDERVVDVFELMVSEGDFEIVSQTDDRAQAIQLILQDAAARAEKSGRLRVA